MNSKPRFYAWCRFLLPRIFYLRENLERRRLNFGIGKYRVIKFSRKEDDIHEVISNLLVERQNQKNKEKQNEEATVTPASNADELKKYKDLLDSGIITQEEFDAKKKQILGL